MDIVRGYKAVLCIVNEAFAGSARLTHYACIRREPYFGVIHLNSADPGTWQRVGWCVVDDFVCLWIVVERALISGANPDFGGVYRNSLNIGHGFKVGINQVRNRWNRHPAIEIGFDEHDTLRRAYPQVRSVHSDGLDGVVRDAFRLGINVPRAFGEDFFGAFGERGIGAQRSDEICRCRRFLFSPEFQIRHRQGEARLINPFTLWITLHEPGQRMTRVVQLPSLCLQFAYLEHRFFVEWCVGELLYRPFQHGESCRRVLHRLYVQKPGEVTECSHRFVFGVIVQDELIGIDSHRVILGGERGVADVSQQRHELEVGGIYHRDGTEACQRRFGFPGFLMQ